MFASIRRIIILSQHDASHTSRQIAKRGCRGGSQDLERVADELLHSHNLLGKGCGLYTEKQLHRKCRNEEKHLPRLISQESAQGFADYVVQRQIDDLVDVSRLTTMQEICFRLAVAGVSVRAASRDLNVRKSVIAVHLRAAVRKVTRARREGPHAGWYEVYLSEIRRYKSGKNRSSVQQ